MVIYTYCPIEVNFGECINEKIFVLTGEPSGDKLASKVIRELKKLNQTLNT